MADEQVSTETIPDTSISIGTQNPDERQTEARAFRAQRGSSRTQS
jgi:hypothetical protein